VLLWRLISSAIIISLLLVAVYFDFSLGQTASTGETAGQNLAYQGILTSILCPIFTLAAAGEFLFMTSDPKEGKVSRLLSIVSITAVVICSCVPVYQVPYPAYCSVGKLGWPVLGILIGVALCFTKEVFWFDPGQVESRQGMAIRRLAMTFAGMIYIGIPMAILVQIRMLGENGFGIWALLSVMVIPKSSDAGAYFAGRFLGKHKLAPALSPKKTVEGAVGGVLAGIGSAIFMWMIVAPQCFGATIEFPWPFAILYGITLTFVGMIGDLAESLIKRDSGIKDSSNWLPGLGGVLDVIDSVLFCSPAAFVFWIAMSMQGSS